MIRVILPAHLRTLARVEGEVRLDVAGPVSIKSILDELESKYPVLKGTIRDHGSMKRRPLVRFYACREDYSHVRQETILPEAIASGEEPFLVVGSMAGG